MTIRWRKEMSVGNTWIDHDHKYLLCLINTVELALKVGDQEDFLSYTLDQLRDYTVEHFGREEKIMRKIQYPKYADHKAQHQELLKTLETLRGQVEKLMPTTSDAVAGEADGSADTKLETNGGADAESAELAAPPQERDGDSVAGIDADIDALLEPESATPEVVDHEAIVELLRHWILDHVLKTDLQMKPLLSRHPPNYF